MRTPAGARRNRRPVARPCSLPSRAWDPWVIRGPSVGSRSASCPRICKIRGVSRAPSPSWRVRSPRVLHVDAMRLARPPRDPEAASIRFWVPSSDAACVAVSPDVRPPPNARAPSSRALPFGMSRVELATARRPARRAVDARGPSAAALEGLLQSTITCARYDPRGASPQAVKSNLCDFNEPSADPQAAFFVLESFRGARSTAEQPALNRPNRVRLSGTPSIRRAGPTAGRPALNRKVGVRLPGSVSWCAFHAGRAVFDNKVLPGVRGGSLPRGPYAFRGSAAERSVVNRGCVGRLRATSPTEGVDVPAARESSARVKSVRCWCESSPGHPTWAEAEAVEAPGCGPGASGCESRRSKSSIQ